MDFEAKCDKFKACGEFETPRRGDAMRKPRTELWNAVCLFCTACVFCVTFSEHLQARQTDPHDAAIMSAKIDQRIDEKLKNIGWEAAEECSDASFIRRAYLDLTGSVPRAAEVVEFIEDTTVNKRSALLRRLVGSPAHSEHLAAIWAQWLTPERDDMPNIGQGQGGLQVWLRSRFRENLRYDRLVADMLVSSGSANSGPTSFFVALERKPEKIATQTARVFMGVQLDCAQCHDHPFDQWKQRDFWGFAAYFAQISRSEEMAMQNADVIDQDSGEVTIPNTEEVVSPKPLVETNRTSGNRGTRRQQLTLWLTTKDNPFLARATVNRVWALLMGRGLVEPIDDMRADHPASHPELMNELAAYFTDTDYDLRKLFLAITGTRAYSRSTRHASGQSPEDSYAVMITKPLTERQLANSVAEIARQLGDQSQAMQQQLIRQLGKLRGEASQSKLGIVNALVTLHGDLVNQASSEQSSRLLKALQAPHLDRRGQIRWLYLTVLARPPMQTEEQMLSTLVSESSDNGKSNGVELPPADATVEIAADATDKDQSKAAASSKKTSSNSQDLSWQSDLLWALLNSSEFAMTP